MRSSGDISIKRSGPNSESVRRAPCKQEPFATLYVDLHEIDSRQAVFLDKGIQCRGNDGELPCQLMTRGIDDEPTAWLSAFSSVKASVTEPNLRAPDRMDG